MLTSAQSIVRYDFRDGTVAPDRLTRAADRHYLAAARSMLSLYRRGEGATRRTLHRRVDTILDRLGDCPPRRAAAFCKLLDDRSTYRTAGGKAANLRRRVFTTAAELHPVVETKTSMFEHARDAARSQVAESIGKPWPEIEAELFADVIELQTLLSFDAGEAFGPAELLAAYNLGQTQAALYRATRMTVWAREDLKTIARHAKLAGLMHRITRQETAGPRRGDAQGPATYRFELDGPASAIRHTWRYGVRFATLLPMLIACRGWRLAADVLGPGAHGKRDRTYRLELAAEDGLRGPHGRPADFDSQLERQLLERWERERPAGWTLTRESELLFCGQSVLTPDFVLRRDDRPREPVYVELVGYWTPEYLRDKGAKLRQFRDDRWVIVVPPKGRETIPDGLAVLELKGKFDPAELARLAADQLDRPAKPTRD